MDLENEFAYYVGNLQELRTGRLSIGGDLFFLILHFPTPDRTVPHRLSPCGSKAF